MPLKLTLSRDEEAYGPLDDRWYVPSSEITATYEAGRVRLRIERDEQRGKYPQPAETAVANLDDDERRALIAFLSSLDGPAEVA